ncbi:MAG TPA: DUF5719 family protein [Microbacterium sp.]|uniref:DUF5719 family protein n=1 Tax=Microbacterium sp. TaxID=51671 RepID=UPI002B49F3E1|nr:DUF5719 family protein [Microbacterium sp.]HKT56432.1 DUF5719 family protein [Microbacterium sp.]
MSGSRTIVTTGLRLGGAVLVVAAAVLGTTFAVAAGLPGHRSAPVSADVAPPASANVLACDGPLLALGRDASSVGQLTVAAPQQLAGGTPAGTAPSDQTSLHTPDVSGGTGPYEFTTPAAGRTPAQVGVAGSAQVNAPDLSGFAASACQPGLMQSWLVGGSAGTGSTDLVLLANPGAVAATVQVTVYGPDGATTPPGGGDVIVPAHTQRVLPLAGLALGTDSPVVKVVATGAPVQASIQTSIIRTLVPGGVDQVSAIPAATRTQVIPGVRVTGTSDASSAPLTVLRVLAPTENTRATVTVTGADGRVAQTRTVPLTAGQPVEVALDGLTSGVYTVRVTAPAVAVASVWSATGIGTGDDFAWNATAPTVRTTATVAVPDGAGPMLSIVNTGTRSETVAVQSLRGGTSQTLTLPPGGGRSLPAVAGGLYEVTPRGGQIAASVSFASRNAVAAFPVWAADAASPELTVYP